MPCSWPRPESQTPGSSPWAMHWKVVDACSECSQWWSGLRTFSAHPSQFAFREGCLRAGRGKARQKVPRASQSALSLGSLIILNIPHHHHLHSPHPQQGCRPLGAAAPRWPGSVMILRKRLCGASVNPPPPSEQCESWLSGCKE